MNNKCEYFLTKWYSFIILRHASETEKASFRILENLIRKTTNADLHVKFNEQCLQHDLLPTYTNIRLYNAQARDQAFVKKFRRNLIIHENEKQKEIIVKLKHEIQQEESKLKAITSSLRFNSFIMFLNRIKEKICATLQVKHQKKLCNIYSAHVPVNEEKCKWLNLTNVDVKEDIQAIFQLGMNCHLKSRYDHLSKKIEIEKLYDTIKMHKSNKELVIQDEEALKCELKRFGLRTVTDYNKNLLTKQQYALIEEFKSNENIIIRKADKSNTFVIMNSEDYNRKLNDILDDPQKFKPIRKNNVEDIKHELNELIEVVNSRNRSIKLKPLEGHYEPGYMYGSPKIHKNDKDPPLRPIISQIGTPVYSIAQTLNTIISKYMPKKYMINSTHEFMEICKSLTNIKQLASLDVESLFTHVPVKETIDIILQHTYNHPSIPSPDIPKAIMKELLMICTTKSPFRNSTGKLFVQIDGVSIGSPLGPTMASFYMCELENKAMESLETKPIVYCRYVDDCFLAIENIQQLYSLKAYFENNSVLSFMYETEIKKQLPFLDIKVKRQGEKLTTEVYTKATNSNECLNFNSICPLRYKEAVVKTFLNRAFAVCSSWDTFHTEVQRIRQVLVNNSYPINTIDNTINKFISNKFSENVNSTTSPRPCLYYRNQYSSQAREEEKNLQNIIKRHIKATKENQNIDLRIYYQNKKLKSSFIRNNQHASKDANRVVYQYECGRDTCNGIAYIGYTTCSLPKRFYQHVQTGAIHNHNRTVHSTKPYTRDLLQSTTILYRNQSKSNLQIAEALLIKEHKPHLNQQDEGTVRVLNIF